MFRDTAFKKRQIRPPIQEIRINDHAEHGADSEYEARGRVFDPVSGVTPFISVSADRHRYEGIHPLISTD